MDARVTGCRPGLRSADEPLDRLQLRDVDGSGRLGLEKGPDSLGDLARSTLARGKNRAHVKGPAKLLYEVDMPVGRLVPDRDVAAGLVGHVHLVPLLTEADERAPHADHVVVGMGTKNHDPLGELGRPGRLSAGYSEPPRLARAARRPAGDRVLHSPEDIDVEVVGPALVGEQVLKAMLVVVLIDQLEDWLTKLERQPTHRLADERVGPFKPQRLERPDEPGRLKPRQL